jgi:hypothetical protein
MDQRFKEIIAAADLIIGDWERVRPPTCLDAVELNWKLRKLHIARELLADIASEQIRSHPHTREFAGHGGGRALYRRRVE